MDRRQYLKRHEDHADQRQRQLQWLAPLDSADEAAHRDGERGGQDAAHHQHAPPRGCEQPIGLRQDGGEDELVAGLQPGKRRHAGA